jgi:hypothetical protein
MKLARTARSRGEGNIVFLVIVGVLVAGVVWWLYSSRQDAVKKSRAFAAEVVTHVAVNFDEKYLHVHLSPEAQVNYLQSWRERFIARLRELGVPSQPIEVKGDVTFTSQFFDPRGTFRAELKYPTTSAYIDVEVSRGMTVWQVDKIDLTWTPPPTPTPAPVLATPTPTPAPPPEQKPKRKGKS